MERTRIARRVVRVAECAPVHTARASVIRTTGQSSVTTPTRETANRQLFAGLVEVLYAQQVLVAARADICTTGDRGWAGQVHCVSVYLDESATGGGRLIDGEVDATVSEKVLTTVRQNAHTLQWKLSSNWSDGAGALSRDELANALEDVAQVLVDAFHAVQVQTFHASTSQRAKVEHKLLQQCADLDVVVLKHLRTGGHCVRFAVPLFGENAAWTSTRTLVDVEDVEAVYLPASFAGPNFCTATEQLTICIGYPLDNDEKTEVDDGSWPVVIEWPARMLLSSQVTQLPASSRTVSSVELIDSCKKMVLQQWKRRKDFIGDLRRYAVVLEYDAVDFSQVFFMLQEQLNAQAPLRIIVLRLEFTAAFFSTNRMSDLRVTLLDGEDEKAPVVVVLAASDTPISLDTAANSQACVARFLEHTHKSLLEHLYGE